MTQRFAPPPNNIFGFDEVENDVSDDEFSQTHDEVGIHEIAAEIRRRNGIFGQDDTSSPRAFTTNAEDNVFSAFDDAFCILKHEDTKGCANCSKKIRVTNVLRIQKGQHIVMPGKKFKKYVKRFRKSIKFYDHHAIVKEVKKCEGSCIKMVLIHFTKIEGKYKVYEETNDYNLNETELYIKEYVFPKYNPDEIIARASSQNDEFKTYCFLTNNCEHFATWCIVGKSQSFQFQSLKQKISNIVTGLFGAESRITRGILRLLFSSSDEIAIGLSCAVPGLVLGGGTVLYLIYCIFMTVQRIRDYRNGEICRSCLKGELMDLWLTFGAFGLASTISFLIYTFLIPLLAPAVGIPLMILVVILAIAFQMTVPKIRKVLCSPFSVDRFKVNDLDQINIGDVVSKIQYGVHHTMIVTTTQGFTNNKQTQGFTKNKQTEGFPNNEQTKVFTNHKQTKGWIRVVHYGSSFLFGSRKIVEQWFEVDLEKSSIYLFVCDTLPTYPADVVISRARSRIGESKWAAFSNRSAHLAYWSKVIQFDDCDFNDYNSHDLPNAEEIPLSCSEASLFIKEIEIYSITDLRIGHVVKSDIIGRFDDTGILTSLRSLDDKGRTIEIQVCTYSFSLRVSLKHYVVDLDKNRLFVKIYNPTQCQSTGKRAQNALDVVGAKGWWWTTEGFIRHCIERKSQ